VAKTVELVHEDEVVEATAERSGANVMVGKVEVAIAFVYDVETVKVLPETFTTVEPVGVEVVPDGTVVSMVKEGLEVAAA
jgi:hypothetical protein